MATIVTQELAQRTSITNVATSGSLIIKVDIHRGQSTQFEIVEEHRKFRQELKPFEG